VEVKKLAREVEEARDVEMVVDSNVLRTFYHKSYEHQSQSSNAYTQSPILFLSALALII
jgi:hypothetical protein